MLTGVESRLEITVTANTANVKWIAFSNGGYYYQDGAAGAMTNNSWTGDYWTAVIEKALDYYAYAEITHLKVCLMPPALHVAGALSAYRHVQYAAVPGSMVTAALGASLEGFS